jgi:2-polyprenyl-3-methyl-5-hydroxy-6-metoxy-1,4-benzoquinol methylase
MTQHRSPSPDSHLALAPSAETAAPPTVSDPELKARHRAMWASGDYPSMVETWLLPLGPRLVEASGIGPGMRVLDVAAGTGNASIPAAQAGADVTASDLTPELLEAGRRRAEAADVDIAWVEADAEHLPFEDGSFDVVISAIGAMFAPHHQQTADELVRVCRPGGTIGLLNLTPDFQRPRDFGEHFKALHGPTIAAQGNARRNGRIAELEAALDRLCDEWNRGTPDRARFELQYLLAVGTRA